MGVAAGCFCSGANARNRTEDLLITSELLYQLSYVGTENRHERCQMSAPKSSLRLPRCNVRFVLIAWTAGIR